MPKVERLDAVVIGATTRGLAATYVLSNRGRRAVLLERAPQVGGGDGSFVTADGSRFEYGMHVLDDMRSEVATRLFKRVVDGQVHRVKLKRAIVLRNQIIPYAPAPAEMPAEFHRMLPGDDLVDDLGNEPPTRERLAAFYGREYVDLVFDEVLPSYPSEHRHVAFGVPESELMANIYPWFFPRARRRPRRGDESRAFHDRLRNGVDQYILYPRDGGFAGFCEGFVHHFDPERIEVICGVGDFEIVLEADSHRIEGIEAAGRRFKADQYFWASSWPELCRLLRLPCQETATDRVVIGSFRLNRPARTEFYELLVGDPRHSINRLYFPAAFREAVEPLMQIEYAFPVAEERSLAPEHWRTTWLGNLRSLELLDETHEVEMFDFKTRTLHFNSFGMEGERLRDADLALLKKDTNIYPVVPSMANLNLNTHIPRDLEYVESVAARL